MGDSGGRTLVVAGVLLLALTASFMPASASGSDDRGGGADPVGAADGDHSHFRYGHIFWSPGGAPNTVAFTVQNAWRRSAYNGDPTQPRSVCVDPSAPTVPNVPCSGADGHPEPGDVVLESVGVTRFATGDGTVIGSPRGNLLYLVTSVDRAGDWLFGLALDPAALPAVSTTILHTYATAGAYNASIATCCRIVRFSSPNEHINNPNASYRIETRVDTEAEQGSPVSVMPPVVQCPIAGRCAFTVPATDPAGDGLAFRFATAPESGITTQPGPPHAPHAATIDASTGLFEWETAGATLATGGRNTLYSTQVVIEDRDPDGGVRSKVAVDFFIQLVDEVGEPPVFDDPAAPPDAVQCGTTVPGSTQVRLTLTAWASDADGDDVTLNVVGLPPGAVMDPSLPHTGSGLVASRFSWTPDHDQVGSHVLTFIASDSFGQSAQCPITILVAPTRFSNYVALGDSYASGFGVAPYDESAFGGAAHCQRSTRAYSQLLRLATSPLFQACQGAMTADMVAPRGERKPDEPWGPAQFDWLWSGVDLVTLSIGGNDAGFAEVLRECILGWNLLPFVTCHDDEDVINTVDGAFARLAGRTHAPAHVVPYASLFRQIRTDTGGAVGVAVGYPPLFPERAGRRAPLPGARCEGVKQADQRWVVEKTNELNGIKEGIANRYGLLFADTTPKFEGHELCGASGDEWHFPLLSSGRMHPNADGHEAIAEVVDDVLEGEQPLQFVILPGETRVFSSFVDAARSLLTLFTTWPGSDVVTTLIAPDGTRFDRSTQPGGNVLVVEHGPNWEEIQLADPEPGEWSIEVHGADVGSGGELVTVSLHAEEPPNEPPVARFDWELDGGLLHLDASASFDPDGEIEFYDWYIASEEADDLAEGRTVTQELNGEGPWTVTLFVVDDEGASASASVTVVAIDILPRHRGQPRGLTPVVVRSTGTFNATAIAPETLRFGPGGARARHVRAVDHTGNGLEDLLVLFPTEDARLGEASGFACVHGELPEPEDHDRLGPHRRAFSGCDSVGPLRGGR